MNRISRQEKDWMSLSVSIIFANNSLNDVHERASLNTRSNRTARSEEIAPPPKPPSINALMINSKIEMITTEPSKILKLSLQ